MAPSIQAMGVDLEVFDARSRKEVALLFDPESKKRVLVGAADTHPNDYLKGCYFILLIEDEEKLRARNEQRNKLEPWKKNQDDPVSIQKGFLLGWNYEIFKNSDPKRTLEYIKTLLAEPTPLIRQSKGLEQPFYRLPLFINLKRDKKYVCAYQVI